MNNTDLIDHHVVDFPLTVDEVQTIIDRQCAVGADDFCFYVRKVSCQFFAVELNFLIAGSAHGSTISNQKLLREGSDEFTLLDLVERLPMPPQGLFGQFREIESCIDELEGLVRQTVCPQFRNWGVHQDGDEF